MLLTLALQWRLAAREEAADATDAAENGRSSPASPSSPVFRLWSRGSSPGFTLARQLHPVRGPPRTALLDPFRHLAHVERGELADVDVGADLAQGLEALGPASGQGRASPARLRPPDGPPT